MTPPQMTNSELEGAIGGHEATTSTHRSDEALRRGATTDVAPPRVFPWWKGRRGDTNERGSIFF